MVSFHPTSFAVLLGVMVSFPPIAGYPLAARRCGAEETGDGSPTAMLAAAAAASGDRAIRSATLTYSVDGLDALPSDASVQQAILAGRETYSRAIANAVHDDVRERLQKHLDDLEATVRRNLTANARASLEIHYAMSGANLGGDRFFEITRHAAESTPATVEVTYRTLGAGAYLALRRERRHSTALIEDRPMDFGTAEPHRLGRLSGTLAELVEEFGAAAKKAVRELEPEISLEEAAPFQGHDSYRINLSFRRADRPGEASGSATVGVVPGMGHVTPLIRDFLADGTLVAEWESSDYVPVPQRDGEPIWFPLKVSYRQNDHEGHPIRSEDYRFRADAIALNGPVPQERFRIPLDPSMTVADTRVNPAVTYAVRNDTTLGLDDVDSLASNASLEPIVVRPRTDAPAPMPGWRMPRGLVVNLAILAALAGLLWWRRKRATLAVLLLAVTLPGCGRMDGVGLAGGRSAGAATASDPDRTPMDVVAPLSRMLDAPPPPLIRSSK